MPDTPSQGILSEAATTESEGTATSEEVISEVTPVDEATPEDLGGAAEGVADWYPKKSWWDRMFLAVICMIGVLLVCFVLLAGILVATDLLGSHKHASAATRQRATTPHQASPAPIADTTTSSTTTTVPAKPSALPFSSSPATSHSSSLPTFVTLPAAFPITTPAVATTATTAPANTVKATKPKPAPKPTKPTPKPTPTATTKPASTITTKPTSTTTTKPASTTTTHPPATTTTVPATTTTTAAAAG